MKLLATLSIASALATETRMSLIVGVEQGLCNGKDMCGQGKSSICMRINEEAIAYFGKSVGEVGDERCSCIFQHRWHMSQGRNFEVIGSKSPECGYKALEEFKLGAKTYKGMEMLTLVEGTRDELELASDATSGDRCANGYKGK